MNPTPTPALQTSGFTRVAIQRKRLGGDGNYGDCGFLMVGLGKKHHFFRLATAPKMEHLLVIAKLRQLHLFESKSS